MLNKLLSLYLQSLVTTTILVGIASCIWIGYRALKKKDKTAKQRQAHLYDILLIDIMTIPILTFAVIGILFIIQARELQKDRVRIIMITTKQKEVVYV